MVELLDADVRARNAPAARRYVADTGVRSAEPTTRSRPLLPLILDLGVPLGAYYAAHDVVGTAMITAFAASGIASLIRLIITMRRERSVSGLSVLVLCVNVAGIVLTFVGGDVRVVAGKDAVISSVVGFGIVLSVLRGRPALAEAMRPFVTHGRPGLDAAWDRLAVSSPPFRRLVATHSAILGVAFVLDCVVRVLCAAFAPLAVLGWIGTAATVGALLIGGVVSAAVCGEPTYLLVAAESRNEPTGT